MKNKRLEIKSLDTSESFTLTKESHEGYWSFRPSNQLIDFFCDLGNYDCNSFIIRPKNRSLSDDLKIIKDLFKELNLPEELKYEANFITNTLDNLLNYSK